MRRSFPYSRRSFLQNAVLVAVAMPVTLALFVLMSAGTSYLVAIVLLETIVLVVLGISPLLTTHEVADDILVLRQGWYFRARIPLADIRSAERVESGPARTGVFFRLLHATLYVTSRRHDLIEIHLRSKRPFGFALGKRADRVVFDVEDPDALLRTLGTESLLSPVDA
ncbi:MAG: hypothetical protein SA339_14020 [Methanomassiliicoccus sp.]|nr:hypothetical protein [Methanomassiliicoccus sp.]